MLQARRSPHLSLLGGFVLAFAFTFVMQATAAFAICQVLEGNSANNGRRGNLFELEAINNLIIRNFEVHTGSVSGGNPIEVWYNRTTDQINDPGWEYVGVATLAATANQREFLPLDIDVFVPAGENIFFCVVSQSNSSVRYTTGSVPDINDGNLIIDGSGGEGGLYDSSNTPPFDPTNYPRAFAGAVHYELVDDPHIYVTYDGWSLGCEGVRELDVGEVSDDGMTRVTLDVENFGDSETLELQPPFDVTIDSGSFSIGPDVSQPTATLLGPGEDAKFYIEFQPDAGAFEFTVEIDSNDPNVPAYPVTIVGEAVGSPNLEVSVESTTVAHNFVYNAGAVASGAPQSLNLELLNSGAQTLDLGSPTFQTDEISGSYSASPDVVYSGGGSIPSSSAETAQIEFTVDQAGFFAFRWRLPATIRSTIRMSFSSKATPIPANSPSS